VLGAILRRAAAGGALIACTAFAAPVLAHERVTDDGAISDTWAAMAHHQHDGQEGHIAPVDDLPSFLSYTAGGFRVELADGPGRVADVSAKGWYAYLTSFDEPVCSTGGVYVVDLRTKQRVARIPSHTDTFAGEGSQVITLDTPYFKGDVLLYNNETCGDQGVGGVTIVDVRDPRRPKKLVEGFGDFTNKGRSQRKANQIHSAFGWQDAATGRAYAILVDDMEATDVDIIDITNPSRPTFVSETDWSAKTMANEFPGGPHNQTPFLHDMVVKRIAGHYVGLLSYWDGGYLKLNLDNPASPTYIDDSAYDRFDLFQPLFSPEGNGHQSEFTRDNAYTIATDEDFDATRLVATAGVGAGEFEFTGTQGSDTPKIDADTSLAGPTKGVGLACDAGSVPAPGSPGVVAVIERGVCDFTVKVGTVESAGYVGAIVFNRTGDGGCEALVNMSVSGGIPAMFVARRDGFRILGQDLAGYVCSVDGTGTPGPAAGTAGLPVNVRATFDGWGYIHLFAASNMNRLDSFAIPESQDPSKAEGFGDLSVHEVATDPERDVAYISYYAGGLRVLSYRGGNLRQIGAFVDEGGNNFWGVEWHRTPDGQRWVLASDRDYGLYAFKLRAP